MLDKMAQAEPLALQELLVLEERSAMRVPLVLLALEEMVLRGPLMAV
jgi:hypothetical protein